MPVIRDAHVVYTVQPGDTLYSIAQRFSSTVSEIVRVNFQDPHITEPDMIYSGWTIVIPVYGVQPPYPTTYVTTPGDTLSRIGERLSAHTDLLAGVNRLQDPNRIFVGQPLWIPAFVYEVESGDTLFRLSKRFNVPIATILKANAGRPGLSIDFMYVGFRLLIPLRSSRNIVVTEPLPSNTLRDGDRVEGFARVFEANVLMQVRDDHNVVVSNERFTTAFEGPPAYGYFSGTIPFDRQPTTHSGELWVYSRSARDGSIIDLVQVKVNFT